MIYTVTLNPAVDKTVYVDDFTLDAVNRAREVRQDAGGKGINVSKTIAALGGESVALAILGGASGSFIAGALEAAGIESIIVPAAGDTRTNTKVVDLEKRTYTDINEPGAPVTPELLDGALATLVDRLSAGDVVVLSGSLPAGAPQDTYATWADAAKAAGALVFLDADGDVMRAGLAAAPYLAKPNEVELARIMGRELDDDAAIIDAARELIAQGTEQVMVSMGGAGALFVSASEVLRAHQPTVEVVSTVGAGDSVVAALAVAHARGMEAAEAARLAMAVGAATVMQPGTKPADIADIERLLDQVQVEAV